MKPLSVFLIQTNLKWMDIDANLESFEEKIRSLKGNTDLIILPEMFTTGFTSRPEKVAEPVNGKTYKWMQNIARQTKAVIMGSAIIKEKTSTFNRMVIARPNGEILHYDKKHLFRLGGENRFFTAGSNREAFEVNGWKIMPMICYDLRFPVWSRNISSENQHHEYDVIVYVANWPLARVTAWDTLLKARAIENSCYSIGVNRIGKDGYATEHNGHSAIYDYFGNSLLDLNDDPKHGSTELSWQHLSDYREKFGFQMDADPFEFIDKVK